MDALQLKMARVALGITVRQAAEICDVSHDTITRLEAGHGLKESTVAKVRAALETAGVEFIPENGGGAGVRLKKRGEAERVADSLAALTQGDGSKVARDRADTIVHQYLASIRRPKDVPAERVHLLQLFWALANPGDVAEKVAAVIEGRDV